MCRGAILCLVFASYGLAEAPALRLSEERQKVVDRYMNVLLEDARNEFAFHQVYSAFKAEGKEYLLVNFFQNAIRLEPNKANLHLILGQLYASFRDLYQAGVKFKDAGRMAPNDYYARYLLASVYFKQRNYPDAASEFRIAAALASDMDDRVRSLFGLARVHAALEKWDDAQKTWEEIAELRPYDAATFRQLTEAARDFSRFDLAERWLRSLQELLKEDSEGTCFVLLDLADVAVERQRFDEAVESYRKAKTYLSESHWLSDEINARIRKCFAGQSRGAELRQQLEDRVGKSPQELDSLLELAEVLVTENAIQKASDCLKAASEASPRDVQILEKYRSLLVQLKDDAGVEAVSKRLIALSPQNVQYRLQDADYHVSRGNRDRAKAVWDEVIQEDPQQPVRYLSVARAMRRVSELDWAEVTYRKLVEVAPEVEAHKLELAELYLRRADETPPAEAGAKPETPAAPAAGEKGAPAESPALKQWAERCEGHFQKARELLLGASQRAKLTLAETQYAGQLLLDHRRLDAAKEVLDMGRKRFSDDMGLARMLGEACLRLGATGPQNSAEQNALYDEAVASYMSAFDLAPHPAIQREMNSELLSLCLGYGPWKATDGRGYRGGQRGLQPLLEKHVRDHFARPKDPMPAWCIADIQQQAPDGYYSFTNIPNGPDKTFGFYTGDAARADVGLGYFSEALQRDPLLIAGYLGKSVSYTMRDSFEQAVMELRKAAVIDPVNKWKYFLQIGDLFANEGQIEEAMAFWSRVSERVFTDATILYQLGCRHFRAERTAQAIELLQRAIQANPNIHFYHMTLGNMYDYLGDHPKAVAEYRKALELSTQSMLLPVRQRLSVVQQTWAYDLFDKREHEAALRQFKEIRAFQEVLEKYYRAEKDQRGLERLSPESADVQVQIARCCEALGRAEQAKPLYDRVTQELPTALIRISPIRKMSLRYLLQLKTQMGALKPDNMNVAGSAEAKPFKLRLVQHTRLHDIARQHSVTPNGVLYSGLSSWVEVDPLSGKVLRQAPAGKVTVYESGIEVQVTREDKSDVIRIVRDGKSVTVPSLGEFRVRVPSLQISAERVFLTGKVGGATRIIALDAGTGAIAWNVEAPGHTQDTVFGEKYVASIESNADRSTAVVRDATTAKTLLTKELPGEGIWIAPAIWADKLFLAEDTTWTLYMMDIATGEFDYSLAFQDIFPRPPLVHEGILYLHVRGYRDRTIYLYAIQPETGQILWKTDMKAMSVHSPPIFRGPDLVYLNPETNTVFMIDRATGVRHAEASYEDQTTQQQRDYIHSLRAFGPHLLIVGGRGDIHAFELLTQ